MTDGGWRLPAGRQGYRMADEPHDPSSRAHEDTFSLFFFLSSLKTPHWHHSSLENSSPTTLPTLLPVKRE
jgi:hypothetical protein